MNGIYRIATTIKHIYTFSGADICIDTHSKNVADPFGLCLKEGGKKEGEKEGAKEKEVPKEKEAPARQLVTSDGAYATQSAFNLPKLPSSDSSTEGLRSALREGESFTAACACSALAKLALRVDDPAQANRALHLSASLLAYHKQNA
ncbi:jg18742, partial [Pararge aegeria aegeria]